MSFAARWNPSVPASALYAAQCALSGGAPAGGALSTETDTEAAGLAGELAALGLEPADFFAHALPLSVRLQPARPLVEVVLTKLLGAGSAPAAEPLARRLTMLQASYRRQFPELTAELELRAGPLRSLWEARGPGVLASLARLTEAEVVVEEAEIILVRPLRGGAGLAYPPYNALAIEAVLTNAHDALPEVLRIAWLWSQLHLDVPRYQDAVGRDRLRAIGPAAMLPPVLAAAEDVELARLDRPTVELALTAWNVAPGEADVLLQWWTTYQESNPPWPVALAALDRMLAPS